MLPSYRQPLLIRRLGRPRHSAVHPDGDLDLEALSGQPLRRRRIVAVLDRADDLAAGPRGEQQLGDVRREADDAQRRAGQLDGDAAVVDSRVPANELVHKAGTRQVPRRSSWQSVAN